MAIDRPELSIANVSRPDVVLLMSCAEPRLAEYVPCQEPPALTSMLPDCVSPQTVVEDTGFPVSPAV